VDDVREAVRREVPMGPWVLALLSLLLLAAAGCSKAILKPVRFPGAVPDAPPLAGLLSRPAGAGTFPALVLLHGCGGMYGKSGRLSARQRAWDDALRREGFVTLHVDSFTPRDVSEVCTVKDRQVSVWNDRRPDAYAALSFLRSLPFVRPNAVAVMGWSMGGLTVLAAMERGEGSPVRGFFAGVALYPGCRLAQRGEPRPSGPLLMLLGEADDWTPPERCGPVVADARGRGETVEVESYPGAFHGFDWPGNKVHLRSGLAKVQGGCAHVGENPEARRDALKRVPEFLKRHLPATSPPP